MTFLVDTSVLSSVEPRRQVSTEIAAWVDTRSRDFFISVVTLIEIEQGIAKLEQSGSTRRTAELSGWLQRTMAAYGRRIIGIDRELALVIGRLSGRASAIGRHPGFADVAIAATAQTMGFTVLTRNKRHFEPLGVRVLDPFADPLP